MLLPCFCRDESLSITRCVVDSDSLVYNLISVLVSLFPLPFLLYSFCIVFIAPFFFRFSFCRNLRARCLHCLHHHPLSQLPRGESRSERQLHRMVLVPDPRFFLQFDEVSWFYFYPFPLFSGPALSTDCYGIVVIESQP